MEIKRMSKGNKGKSLSVMFMQYMVIFSMLALTTIMIYFICFVACIDTGIFRSANYLETQVLEQKASIAQAETVKDYIPDECEYVVLDQYGSVQEKNIDDSKTEDFCSRVKNGNLENHGKYYKKIKRTDGGVCIVSYSMHLQFRNPELRKIFPNVEMMSEILLVIVLIIEMILFSGHYRRKIVAQLQGLTYAANRIKEHNLDFNVEKSGISDINQVGEAISSMKDALAASLKENWRNEQERREQISALAHDIKTPLTIIRGNAQLLSEQDIPAECISLNSDIIEETEQIQQYLRQLIEINKSQFPEIKKEHFDLHKFIAEISVPIWDLCKPKNIEFICMENCLDARNETAMVCGDKSILCRVLLNIADNAVTYTPKEGRIKLSFSLKNNVAEFILEDSGKGFDREELANAVKEFYQGDKSRKSDNHYGMGLYLTAKMIDLQGGTLILDNSTELCGAKVTVQIPGNYQTRNENQYND